MFLCAGLDEELELQGHRELSLSINNIIYQV